MCLCPYACLRKCSSDDVWLASLRQPDRPDQFRAESSDGARRRELLLLKQFNHSLLHAHASTNLNQLISGPAGLHEPEQSGGLPNIPHIDSTPSRQHTNMHHILAQHPRANCTCTCIAYASQHPHTHRQKQHHPHLNSKIPPPLCHAPPTGELNNSSVHAACRITSHAHPDHRDPTKSLLEKEFNLCPCSCSKTMRAMYDSRKE